MFVVVRRVLSTSCFSQCPADDLDITDSLRTQRPLLDTRRHYNTHTLLDHSNEIA